MKKSQGSPRKRKARLKQLFPYYYRFTNYFILICIEFFIILLLSWLFPTEKIFFLFKEFFPFLLLIAVFLYLYFLVIEYETKKYLQAKEELEERNTNLNLLVMTSHKISASLNFRKIVQGGFAGLACLLQVKKGFALLYPEKANPEITATYHLNKKTAEIIGGHLKEKRFLSQEENISLLGLEKQSFRTGENSEISTWQNLQILNLLTEKNSLGFLILDTEIPKEKKETVELLCRQLATALENSLLHQEVEKNSIMDPLTKLYNRRLFYCRLNEELERAKRFSFPFSIMLSDIDNFKNYVDNNGHLMGDDALQKIGELTQDALRKIDTVARYGGDEFIYLLPQTNAGNAKNVAQRVKDAVTNYSFPTRNNCCTNLTLSIGIASYSEDAQDSDSLMEKADQALFQAKSKGKNKIFLYTNTAEK